MRVFAVYFDFFKQWEAGSVLTLAEFSNRLVAFWFLVAELITRKGQNRKIFIFIGLI